MSNKKLQYLMGGLVIVVVMVVVSYLAETGRFGVSGNDGLGVEWNKLEQNLVGMEIEVGGETIELAKVGESWEVNGYKADRVLMGQVMESLISVEVGELVSENPENYGNYGLDEMSRVRVKLKLENEEVSLDLGRGGGVVREMFGKGAESEKVYLVRGLDDANLVKSVEEWRDKTLVEVSASEISELAYAGVFGSIMVSKNNEGSFVAKKGAVEKILSETVAQRLVGALSPLKGNRVLADEEVDELKNSRVKNRLEIQRANGETVGLVLAEIQNEWRAAREDEEQGYGLSQESVSDVWKSVVELF